MIAGASDRLPATIAELITPDLAARLDALDVVSRRLFAGKLQGERRSKQRGRSVEFDDYREYVAGDDLRHIDWNVYARLDRLFIKIFQEEQDLALHIILDASPSMNAGTPGKLAMAARLATALGYVGLVNNNRVSVSVLGVGPLRRLEPLRGRRQVQRLAQFILDEALAPAARAGQGAPAGPGFAGALRTLAADPSGRGVVVLLSDVLIPDPGGYAEGLRLLAGGAGRTGQDGYVLQLLSPGELDPAVEGRRAGENGPGAIVGDLRLTDVESGRVAEVTVTPEVLEQYRRSVRRYIDEAAAFCRARGLTHQLVRSDADVAGLVLDGLRRLGLVR